VISVTVGAKRWTQSRRVLPPLTRTSLDMKARLKPILAATSQSSDR
jgi:hypothetical protein